MIIVVVDFLTASTTSFIIDASISFIIYLLLAILIRNFTRKNEFLFVILLTYVCRACSTYFQLELVSSIIDVIILALISAFMVIYFTDIQKIFAKRIRKRSLYNNISADSKEKFIGILSETVLSLSKSKTGAIMTIELGDSLEDYIKKGKRVDAPVSQAVLETIFYEGTPLHDGAVIIRGDMIEAASCFYTPTTRGLNGSYGARHRAALGISEVCDALTVVVSEETGRISFAYKSELIAVSRDDFTDQLRDYLA